MYTLHAVLRHDMRIRLFTAIAMLGASMSICAQCDEVIGTLFRSNDALIHIDSIAQAGAPMLWFSPDEPRLFDKNGHIQLPEPLPYDELYDQPVVYYKIRTVYTELPKSAIKASKSDEDRTTHIDLSSTKALEVEYYFYYKEETGIGGHPHDLESVAIQLEVIDNPACKNGSYKIVAKRIIARAHGLYWFENALNVDEQTIFPICILVEEGKHANCTDKNADGVYTPGFDVTEKVNDAWGVRDIISTGKLFSGGYQAWMAKERTPISLLVPPSAEYTKSYQKVKSRYPAIAIDHHYLLKSFPAIPDDYDDRKLKKMVHSKKPVEWPKVATAIQANTSILRLAKENKLRNKIGFSYRFDEDMALSLSLPLLFVRHVEAPMTGGWFYNKIYLGQNDSTPDHISRSFGHQIQHTNSASRWLDTYVGAGYEYVDVDERIGITDHEFFMVTEIGMKVRINITKTPFKVFKFLGTDYWGIRFGWKNLGFNPFYYSGFVIEVGAGAF